jgi:hypothetical protein
MVSRGVSSTSEAVMKLIMFSLLMHCFSVLGAAGHLPKTLHCFFHVYGVPETIVLII